MSFRTDYFDGSTGLHQKMKDAFDAGVAFVTVDNAAAITTALQQSAAKGEVQFVVSLVTSYQTSILRGNKGNNYILKSYLDGVQNGLASQDIFDFECKPTLNVSSPTDTKIDLNFNFQTT